MLNSGNKNNISIIKWARHLHSISCNGIMYSENEFDRERYLKIRDISAEMPKFPDIILDNKFDRSVNKLSTQLLKKIKKIVKN